MPAQTQALLAWTTAALTFVLILVTGFYAWANYRVMRIMQADVRARTEPIPKIGVDFSGLLGAHPHSIKVHVRVEHAPMRLALLNIALISMNEDITWVECMIGDPRTISPETPVEFSEQCDFYGMPPEWTAIVHYTDLGEALEYHMKLSSHGFSLVQAYSPAGPFRKLVKRISEKMNEMDLPSHGEFDS